MSRGGDRHPGEAARGERKRRLDLLLVERGLAESRERAQALIMAGLVEVEGRPAGKASDRFSPGAALQVRGPDHPYVGRGGVKLAGALDRFGIEVAGRTAIDLGASTGGFTDCLLQRGARKVYAVDVGAGQLHYRLRSDPRIVLMEKCNARNLKPADIPEKISLATLDLSFISLRLVLPAVVPLLADPADLLPLVKPQFEVGRREVGRGGIVRDRALHHRVLMEVAAAGVSLGLLPCQACASPLPGAEGNQEYFLHFRNRGPAPDPGEMARRIQEATAA